MKKKKPDHVRWPAHAYVDLRDQVLALEAKLRDLTNLEANDDWRGNIESRLDAVAATNRVLLDRLYKAEKVAKDALSQVGQWEWQVCRMKEQNEKVQATLYDVTEMQQKVKRLSEAHVNVAQQNLDRDERLRDALDELRQAILEHRR